MAQGSDRLAQVGIASDILFSNDSTKLFAAVGSQIVVINPATGATIASYETGEPLGAMDLSLDGSTLVVLASPATAIGAIQTRIIKFDTATGGISKLSFAVSGSISAVFNDIALLADGSALVSQRSSDAALLHIGLADKSVSVVGGGLTTASLIVSEDHERVLVMDASYYGRIAVYEAGTGIVASTVRIENPFAGASVPAPLPPIGAIIPDGSGYLVDIGLGLFDSNLKRLEWGSGGHSIPHYSGARFSSDSNRLYIAFGEMISVIDAQTGNIMAGYSAGGTVVQPYDRITGNQIGYGDILQISPDDRYLAAITADGIAIILPAEVQSVATEGDDVIAEGAIIFGLGGNDRLGGPQEYQTMYGGPGDDTYLVESFDDVVIEYEDEGYDRVEASIAFGLPEHVEEAVWVGAGDGELSGNNQTNRLTGGAGNDRLHAFGGDDTLIGLAGNDELDGGTGADTMIGGAGDDIYFVDDAGDVLTELPGEGTDEVCTTLETFTLGLEFEILTGTGESRQTLIGNDRSNVLKSGRAGAELIGKGGDDHYYLIYPTDRIVELADGGVDTVYSEIGGLSLPDHVENFVLLGTGYDATGNGLDNVMTAGDRGSSTRLRGLSGNDRLTTFGGNDVLDGGAGADVMTGGAGNDRYHVDDTGDVVVELADGGTDEIIASIDYTLGEHLENLTLAEAARIGTGNAGDNLLIGSALNNILIGLGGNDRLEGLAGDDRLEGGSGDDWLDGGAGADTMIGGAGADTYIVDNIADVVVERPNEGRDRILSFISLILPDTIEDLSLLGPAAREATGNNLSNRIYGNGAESRLYGLGGDDELFIFGNGGDLVDGGEGVDTAVFVLPRVYYVVSAEQDGSLRLTSPIEAGFKPVQLIDVEILRFSGIDYAWSSERQELVLINSLLQSFNFVMTDGFAGTAGGSGRVFGTADMQDITVSGTGSLNLDPSFNRGGDTLRFSGLAEEWGTIVSGSTVTISNGETSVHVPVGIEPIVLVFEDGARSLHYDTGVGAVTIGSQQIGGAFTWIDAASDLATPAPPVDQIAPARVYMTPYGSIELGGEVEVYGSAERDTVTVLHGEVTFDPSFNRGGDIIVLTGAASEYQAVRSGSNVRLWNDDTEVTIPVGLSNAILRFDNGSRDLFFHYELEEIMIGNQAISLNPVQIYDPL